MDLCVCTFVKVNFYYMNEIRKENFVNIKICILHTYTFIDQYMP